MDDGHGRSQIFPCCFVYDLQQFKGFLFHFFYLQYGHHQVPASNLSHHNTADYARARTSDQTLRSLRTTLRD